MRLPCPPNAPNKTHFLTDYYGETLFKLKMVDFINTSDNAFLQFYNEPPVKIKGRIGVDASADAKTIEPS